MNTRLRLLPVFTTLLMIALAQPALARDSLTANSPQWRAVAGAVEQGDGETPAGETTPTFTDEQIAMLAAIAPPPQLSERELGIYTEPCLPGSVKPEAGAVEGEDYTCGVFTVPQNWDEPDGRNLDLGFLVVKARTENPQPDPLVVLTGGPGQSAIFATHVSKYEAVLQERDLVLFDIRGVGLSQRIGYEECLVLALQNGAPADQIEPLLEAVVGTFLRNAGVEAPESIVPWQNPKTPLFNQICSDLFIGQGLDLNRFSTADNARDTAEIVAALGYDSFNIDSVSYGTRLAMTVMNNIPTYPNAPALRSVILDSAFPPPVYLIRTRARSEHDHLPQLLDECEADAACRDAYPDLGNRLSRLFDSLADEPLTVGEETVTVERLAKQLNGIALTTKAAYIPKMIAELETGVLDTYLALRDGRVGVNDAEEEPPQQLDTTDPVLAFVLKGKSLFDDGMKAALFEGTALTGLVLDDPLGTLPQLFAIYFEGEDLDKLNELLQTITAEDIAASDYVAQLPRDMDTDEVVDEPMEEKIPEWRVANAGQFVWFEYNVVHCIDDILHERFEDLVNSYNDLVFPQIVLSEMDNASYDEMRCEDLPVTAASLEVKNPVSSSVRTLVLQGAYDEQTPVYMGKRAARELENSLFVMVPQGAHGAWRVSDSCVGTIADAFIRDPEGTLDLGCLEAREPQWVLPGESGADTADPGAVPAASASGLPPAPIAVDEGGPQVITGDWRYSSALVQSHWQQPVVALVNVSPYVEGNWTAWAPQDQQYLGRLTTPVAPSPASYRVTVPRIVEGSGADLDNDGEEDAGVQVYALWVASNITGDSYLYQLDQVAYRSYLLDPSTGAFRQGTLLVYAPDDAQGFPSGAGDDGVYFTADDPAVALPAGYTLVTLGEDGQVRFDRSAEATMDTLEEAAVASPNFSDQGILDSFNSLIDLLAVRYSYTDLRDLDWEEIRQRYLPQVEAADAAGDMTAYYLALNDLAISIRDAHVFVFSTDAAHRAAFNNNLLADYGASLGAAGAELDDGRYVITYVDPAGPAAEAGWTFGTEIVTVDGVVVGDRIASLPLQASTGNPEVIRYVQSTLALQFADGAATTIEYRQPGESEVRSATLTAASGLSTAPPSEGGGGGSSLVATRELDGGYGYIYWRQFAEPLYSAAMWERFLGDFHTAPGIVVDLRHNSGGNGELMFTLASYLFPEEKPASYHWLDYVTYDEEANDLVPEHALDFPLYSPKPELTYGGAVVVLVDEGTASAGEYFPQFLQTHERAIVAGERSTEGAGGFVEQAIMPGGITFYFTKGRSYFAGTDELNLEAKGVTLDVRVPATEETEQAKLDGRDPVLEAALAALAEESVKAAGASFVGKTWQLFQVISMPTGPAVPAIPEGYTLTFGEDGSLAIQTDCNQVTAEYALAAGGGITITPGITTLAACPDGSIAEAFVQWLGSATGFQIDSAGLALTTDPESGVFGLLFNVVPE